MIGAEHRYNPIEKECLALVFAMQKMRHYRWAKPYMSYQNSIL